MKNNRFTNYVSVRQTPNGKKYSTNVWDDVEKKPIYVSDYIFKPEDKKSW